jgi:branched-chain amino acid transport system substrate-binding protein
VFKTVIGDISYDKKGDITRSDYVVYTWKKGPDGKVSYFEN